MFTLPQSLNGGQFSPSLLPACAAAVISGAGEATKAEQTKRRNKAEAMGA